MDNRIAIRLVIAPSMQNNEVCPEIRIHINHVDIGESVVSCKVKGLESTLIPDEIHPVTELGYVIRQWVYDRVQRKTERANRYRKEGQEPTQIEMAD